MKTKTGLVIDIHRGDRFIWEQSRQGLKKYSGPLETVVDIGAHVGCFSLAAAQMGAGRVWAFEPVGDNYLRLVKNIVHNGFWGKIVPMPFAVSPLSVSTANIRKAKNSGQYSLKYKKSYPSEICTTWHMREFTQWCIEAVDYLKIDIEGAEWDLFFPPSASLDHFDLLLAKTNFIDLEIHDLSNRRYFRMPLGETRKSMRKKLQAKLLRHGFDDVTISGAPLAIRSFKKKAMIEGRLTCPSPTHPRR